MPDLSLHSAIPGATAAGPKEQGESIDLGLGLEACDLSLNSVNSVNLNRAHPQSEDALRVKAAELWLKLGEADEVLRELGKLHRVIDSGLRPGYTRAHGHALPGREP